MPQFVVAKANTYRAQVLLDLRGALRADQNTSHGRKAQQPSHRQLHQAKPLVVRDRLQTFGHVQIACERVALEPRHLSTLVVVGKAVAR